VDFVGFHEEAEMMYVYRVELSQANATARHDVERRKHAARSSSERRYCWRLDAGSSDDEMARAVAVAALRVPDQAALRGRNLQRALSEEPRWAERKLTGKEEPTLHGTTRHSAGSRPLDAAAFAVHGQAHRTPGPVARDGAPAVAENHLKPWAPGHVVHSPGRWRTSPAWKTCSTSMPKRPIPSGRWSASTKARSSSSARCAQPIPAMPGQLERYDTSIAATAPSNLFVVLDVHRPWRKVKVTERRAAEDYAQCMRELVDVHYPDADTIRVVQDNLSTHSGGACTKRSRPPNPPHLAPPAVHYTPSTPVGSHGRDRDGVLRGQCLDRRIDDQNRSAAKSPLRQRQRTPPAPIKWMFTTDKARAKMSRLPTHTRVIITVQSY